MSQTFSVTGLSCQSCVNHVSVDLEPKGTSTIHVEASRLLSDDEVAVVLADEGGYSLLR